MKKLLFVYNPHSGKGTIGSKLAEIVEIFTAGGYDVTVHPTCASLDGQNYIIKNAEGYDLIVNSGGDGMLHELTNAAIIIGKSAACKYGYIPSGTINDFASSLEIPKDIPAAARMIMQENFAVIDAGKFNDSYFSYVAAFGILTDVSYSTDQNLKNAIGPAAYALNAMRSLTPQNLSETSTAMTIEVNGKKYEDEFMFGLCGNTHSVGGFRRVIPDSADMQDGLLDGIFIRTPKNFNEFTRLNTALAAADFSNSNIIIEKSDKFVIRSGKEVAWTLDGEDGGKTTTVEISAVHNAYEIAVPAFDDK